MHLKLQIFNYNYYKIFLLLNFVKYKEQNFKTYKIAQNDDNLFNLDTIDFTNKNTYKII